MFYLPKIAQSDYEAFGKIMGSHLAYTYDEWLDLSAKWRVEWGQDGIRTVDVNPHQLSGLIARTGRAPDIQSLLILAEELGGGNPNS